MRTTEQGTGAWWLQVCDEDGMPVGHPVKVTQDSEAAIMAELADLGLSWQEVPAP